MKVGKSYIIVSAAIIAIGCFFIGEKPLGEGVFTDRDFWEDVFAMWCIGFFSFLGGIQYERKRRQKEEEKK